MAAADRRRQILDAAVRVVARQDFHICRDADMGDVVAKAQEDGAFRADVTPRFVALAFYGIIEQVLTGWIFDPAPVPVEEIEEAKDLVVAAIVDGLAATASTRAV